MVVQERDVKARVHCDEDILSLQRIQRIHFDAIVPDKVVVMGCLATLTPTSHWLVQHSFGSMQSVNRGLAHVCVLGVESTPTYGTALQ